MTEGSVMTSFDMVEIHQRDVKIISLGVTFQELSTDNIVTSPWYFFNVLQFFVILYSIVGFVHK